jgi:1-acyl-sn-glycerol-3-phosphate acyltransferase
MIPAKHTWLAKSFFRIYVPLIIHYQFRGVYLEEGTEIDPQRPLLILANHFSWWDGFTNYYLNLRYFNKQYHVMMLEEELQKRQFLRNIGAFSVKRGQKSVVESLQYAAGLLQHPQNMLLLFPTGRLQSLYAGDFAFQKGVERILTNAPPNLQVIFSFILPEFGSNPKPALHTYLHTHEDWKADLPALEKAYNEAYHSVLAKQYQRVW